MTLAIRTTDGQEFRVHNQKSALDFLKETPDDEDIYMFFSYFEARDNLGRKALVCYDYLVSVSEIPDATVESDSPY